MKVANFYDLIWFRFTLTSRRFMASSHEWHLRFILRQLKTLNRIELHLVNCNTESELKWCQPFDGDFLARVEFDGQNDRTVGSVADSAQDAVSVHLRSRRQTLPRRRRAIHRRCALGGGSTASDTSDTLWLLPDRRPCWLSNWWNQLPATQHRRQRRPADPAAAYRLNIDRYLPTSTRCELINSQIWNFIGVV